MTISKSQLFFKCAHLISHRKKTFKLLKSNMKFTETKLNICHVYKPHHAFLMQLRLYQGSFPLKKWICCFSLFHMSERTFLYVRRGEVGIGSHTLSWYCEQPGIQSWFQTSLRIFMATIMMIYSSVEWGAPRESGRGWAQFLEGQHALLLQPHLTGVQTYTQYYT